MSVLVLALWSFRETDHLVARRAFSVVNVNDLSWRNRLVAYEGGLQMMATRPWCGFGWDQPKTMYEDFYMPTQLTDGRAIELNDYFMVGLTLGLPALACFVGYLFLSLGPQRTGAVEQWSDSSTPDGGVVEAERWLKATCRAGLVVLLVGFWLQRGLFWLALTVPFWVLLQLGSVRKPEPGFLKVAIKANKAETRNAL
jgi:O-antigen ligase